MTQLYTIHFPKGQGAAIDVAGLGRFHPGATKYRALTQTERVGLTYTPLEVSKTTEAAAVKRIADETKANAAAKAQAAVEVAKSEKVALKELAAAKEKSADEAKAVASANASLAKAIASPAAKPAKNEEK